MIQNGVLWAVAMFILSLFVSITVTAQPVLPSIQAVADSGQIVLSWKCQYEGVKSIAVKRSKDSTANYSTIGYVKQLTKGNQCFIDTAPASGTVYYKLTIVFNSGLSWSSNHCRAAEALPVKVVVPGSKAQVLMNNVNPDMVYSTPHPSFSFKPDYPDIDMSDASFILPRHILLHPVFGHVFIKLPAYSFKQYVYSVSFYNTSGASVVVVPHIKVAEVIIDKRNFGRSGTYKFEIRRDGVLFESGYVTLRL